MRAPIIYFTTGCETILVADKAGALTASQNVFLVLLCALVGMLRCSGHVQRLAAAVLNVAILVLDSCNEEDQPQVTIRIYHTATALRCNVVLCGTANSAPAIVVAGASGTLLGFSSNCLNEYSKRIDGTGSAMRTSVTMTRSATTKIETNERIFGD